jgi:hypothetical protein
LRRSRGDAELRQDNGLEQNPGPKDYQNPPIAHLNPSLLVGPKVGSSMK